MTTGDTPGTDPARALRALLESPELARSCFDFGCTTCGGSTGFKLLNDWLMAHISVEPAARVEQLVRALDSLRPNHRIASQLEAFLAHMQRQWFRDREQDLVGPAVRGAPLLEAAILDLRGRLETSAARRRRAFLRWERMQPEAYHLAKAERMEKARQREAGRAERERLHAMRNNPVWILAYREAKRARKAAAHADRRLAKIEREMAEGRRPHTA